MKLQHSTFVVIHLITAVGNSNIFLKMWPIHCPNHKDHYVHKILWIMIP